MNGCTYTNASCRTCEWDHTCISRKASLSKNVTRTNESSATHHVCGIFRQKWFTRNTCMWFCGTWLNNMCNLIHSYVWLKLHLLIRHIPQNHTHVSLVNHLYLKMPHTWYVCDSSYTHKWVTSHMTSIEIKSHTSRYTYQRNLSHMTIYGTYTSSCTC